MDTNGLIDAALAGDRFNHSHKAALLIMRRMEKYIAFCWKDVRGKNGISRFNEAEFRIATSAGRTEISVHIAGEYMSFVGASNGFGPGSHTLDVDRVETLCDFERITKSWCSAMCPESIVQEPVYIVPAKKKPQP